MYNLSEQLQPNFTLSEFMTSKGAWDYFQKLGEAEQKHIYENIVHLAKVLQHYRDLMGCSFFIVDGLRTPEHNAETPGAAGHSEHLVGAAADFTIPSGFTNKLRELLKDFNGGYHYYSKDMHFHLDVGTKRRW